MAAGAPPATVIWLHGLGDTGDGWADLQSTVGRHMPTVRWVFPTAPVQPVSVNGGMAMTSWFDIDNIPVDEHEPEHPAGLDASIETVHAMLNTQIAAGVDSKRLFLGGFSQGAVMALAAGLAFDQPLGGIIGFSGWATRRSTIEDVIHESNRNTPILMCHGEADMVVSFELGRKSSELLSSIGMQVQFHSYRNMAHTACPQELSELREFLLKHLEKK